MSKLRMALSLSLLLLLLAPNLSAQPLGEPEPGVSDGKTPVLTPDGTWIVPPPGAPMLIVREDPRNIHNDADALDWGAVDLLRSSADDLAPSNQSGEMGIQSCVPYEVGWYETNLASLYGGHAGVIPRNLPPNTSNFCAGAGMGYSAAVSFGTYSWIQAGLAVFPGESSAKWFCKSNDSGTLSTSYGTANSYGNGATVYTWFARDSGGVWRTYRYDTGPYSVQLPCSLTRGASGNLQVLGEIQSASSTSAVMGPWDTFDLRYQSTSGTWYTPTQVQAMYPYSTPCPPYGAGTVSSGVITMGSSQSCTTGTSAYPN